MSAEEQFKNQFYNFIEKVQEAVNRFFDVSAEDNPQIAYSATRLWFLLEGLNSYLEASQTEGVDFQIVDIAIDLIAEELFRPQNLLINSDVQGLISRYSSIKKLLGQIGESIQG